MSSVTNSEEMYAAYWIWSNGQVEDYNLLQMIHCLGEQTTLARVNMCPKLWVQAMHAIAHQETM